MKHTSRYSLDTLDNLVDTIYKDLSHCQVITFSGPLGAGKTTLIKRLLARCGVEEVVTSPTFTYVVVYSNKVGQTFYHFDLYRLTSLTDFMEEGFDEYLYLPNSWALIEWPDIIMPIITKNSCHVTLDYASETERLVTYEKG